ncbi:MAG: YraN family protein [Bacillota bacterium]|nr:YraN family protein [Bacillota bacterium]
MTRQRQIVGMAGEKAAREFLEKAGYSIIEANYRCFLGEIDIIALKADTLIFAEVRTKTGLTFGRPEESVTKDKVYRLRRLAHHYLQSKHREERASRIDLIAVMLDRRENQVTEINHIKGIGGF